jgi:quinol monooxygenase YgiN
MNEFTVIARARAKAGCEARLEKDLRAVARQSREEEGCLLYTLHRACEAPSDFVTIERWISNEAFSAHMTKPYLQDLMRKLPELVDGTPEITMYQQLDEGMPEKGYF